MNRYDRMLAIVIELQRKGWQRASDLATTFKRSPRTIYRDLAALERSGVPIISHDGKGFSVAEGYVLPPLSFSTDEALMLLLGSDLMAGNFDGAYRAAAQSAGRKITSILPERLRPQAENLRGSIHFAGEGSARPAEAARMQLVRTAILERRAVRFRYYARRTSAASRPPNAQEADPYAIAHLGDAWYLAAYCHQRHRVRNFRLDRMDDLVLLDRTFTRPEDFQMERRDLFGPGSFDVRVRFDPAVARWVHESPSFYMIAEEETPEGLVVTLHVRYEEDVLPWLLSWGQHAQVLSPASLVRRIASEAEAMAQRYRRADEQAASPAAQASERG